MRLGISTWSVPWSVGVPGYPQPTPPLSVFDLVDKAVELRVGVLQIADNLPLHTLTEADLERLGEVAYRHGLRLEVGTRGVDHDHLVRYIDIAAKLGARTLRTVLSGSLLTADELAGAETAVRAVLDELDKHGVTLALENNEAFSAIEYAQLVQRISSSHVGICLDTANSLGRPELLQTLVAQLGSHTVMLHAKDYDIQRVDTRMGFSVVGRPAGYGRVDFDHLLDELRARGRNDISVIVEHWPPYEGTIEATVRLEEEWVSRSVEFLRPKVIT
ncbi:MAG TPA: sugar phosphate isomerase/epimerase family protein [Acidimicrobiales bacterium]|nr:sugar phosphate isomerase/epimerase family protein [Acidimicrobiales bacterium]